MRSCLTPASTQRSAGARPRRPRRAAARVAPACVAIACLAVASLSACTPPPAAAPTPTPRAVPPVPRVTGPLELRVVYPVAGSLVQARDSNFIFGSVGSGDATLTIDGVDVPVAPNGAFLAWLPLPPVERSAYELVARTASDSARLTHPIRLAPARPALAAEGPLTVDSASVAPRGELALRPDERVRVAVRAPANAAVWVQPVSGARQPLVSLAAPADSSDGASSPPAPPAGPTNAAALFTTELPASLFAQRPQLVVARGADTLRFPLAQIAPVADPAGPRVFALLGGPADAARDSDRVVVGRPTPNGTYKWFLLPGTVVEVTGRSAGGTRVRLDQSLEVWVDDADVAPLPLGYAPARRVVGGARVVPAEAWVDFVLPTGDRAPYLLTQDGSSLRLTLYGAAFSPDIIPIIGNDTLVRQIVWEQTATDRAAIELRLSQPAYGYRMIWDAARGAMVLRVRRPPRVNRSRPLAGLTIVVDAGHPPGGATGPTGLREPDAVLPVAERVRTMLEARGATVVMTRTTAEPVALADRPVIARRADAHAFVSVHLNAFPDGVNPYVNSGTSTLFYNQSSEPLARLVQRGLVARLGLRDLGVHYQNLAVARPTWYPAVLCEGAFLMFPEQESAMRDPAFQDRYAAGIVEGLERYFADLGAAR